MPDENVTVLVEFARRQYTVSFEVNGEIVQSDLYFLGDVPTPPQVPQTFEKDGYIYSFTGWSEEISPVTEDITYVAKYYSVPASERPVQDTQSAVDAIVKRQIIPAAAILISLIAAIIVAVKVIRSRKRRRNVKKAGNTSEDNKK